MLELRDLLRREIDLWVALRPSIGARDEMVGSLLAIMAGEFYRRAGGGNPLVIGELIGINAMQGLGYEDLALIMTDAFRAKRPHLHSESGTKT